MCVSWLPLAVRPKLFSQCVTFTALYKDHCDYMSSGSCYSLNLFQTSPEESDSVSLPNTDIAQRPRGFVNGGISLPTRRSMRFQVNL